MYTLFPRHHNARLAGAAAILATAACIAPSGHPGATEAAQFLMLFCMLASVPLLLVGAARAWHGHSLLRAESEATAFGCLTLFWAVLSGMLGATLWAVGFRGNEAVALLMGAAVANGAYGSLPWLTAFGEAAAGLERRRPGPRPVNPATGLPSPCRGAPDTSGTPWAG